jgi:hypothetical protein
MTTFKSPHPTGFNRTGTNDCDPNELGPPTTKFGGRPAVPAGPLKRYPGAVADISSGNRRLSKSNHGDGGGSGTRFSVTGGNAFGNAGKSPGKSSRAYDTRGGKGSGTNRK